MSASNGTAPAGCDVSIDLTPSQITEIIRNTLAGSDPSSSSTRLPIAFRGGGSSTNMHDLCCDKKLALSVIQGLRVLCAFDDCGEHSASEIAKDLATSRSTVLPAD